MGKTIIITAVFDYTGDYKHLFKVFKYSAIKNIPGVVIKNIADIKLPEAPDSETRPKKYNAFSGKLRAWADAVKGSDNLIFMDCDMIITADISNVFDKYDFDIAVTARKSKKYSINSGVVFLKPSQRAKKFMDEWSRINDLMYFDKEFHDKWRKKVRGMNQPSLNYLLKHPELHECKVVYLSCQKYNCCEQDWAKMTNAVKIIHLKKPVRDIIFKRATVSKVAEEYAGAEKVIKIYSKYAEASHV